MMKRYTVAFAVTILLSVVLCGGCAALLAVNAPTYYWIPLLLFLVYLVAAIAVSLRFRAVCTAWLVRLCKRIDPEQQTALEKFPLPLLLIDAQGHILFANKLFGAQVTDGTMPVVDTPLDALFPHITIADIAENSSVDLMRGSRRYTAYVSALRGHKGQQYLLYITDDTELKIAAEEYEASRPLVLHICIDNLEESTEHLRAGDRARISGTIETMLEDWISADGGVLQKYGNERFVAVTERRYLSKMQADQFSILKRVRQGFPEVEGGITLSIGVGEGKTVEQGRRMAARALDMALSRGGDQAAVKTVNGFDFYGGHSGGVQHRTRVRSRIIADALRELIVTSDRVLIMGHRMPEGPVSLAA